MAIELLFEDYVAIMLMPPKDGDRELVTAAEHMQYVVLPMFARRRGIASVDAWLRLTTGKRR